MVQNNQEKVTFLAASIPKPGQNHTNKTKGASSAFINTDQYEIQLQDGIPLQDEIYFSRQPIKHTRPCISSGVPCSRIFLIRQNVAGRNEKRFSCWHNLWTLPNHFPVLSEVGQWRRATPKIVVHTMLMQSWLFWVAICPIQMQTRPNIGARRVSPRLQQPSFM